ncbi:MFS transporter [soil metagenome]
MTTTSYRRNIPLFIAFRVLFNARWYYPVMTVLFLDLGLTVEQFALLNVAWAAAIVGLEVPSGALADRFGRKKMVVAAAALMVIEMLVFAFAPRSNPSLLFILFLINRILSGAAEASASGADEALAYDSLVAEGRANYWPRVLELLMRWQSAAFFAAMLIGAAVYDEKFLQSAIHLIGLPWKITRDLAIHLPIYLTLGNALFALLVAINLREPTVASAAAEETTPSSAWIATFATGKWIMATPLVLAVILTGLCFDSITRLFLTFASIYYRMISVPTAYFGVIGSGFALFGFFVPALARRMLPRRSMRANFAIIGVLIFLGLFGIEFVWPIYGLFFLIPIGIAMSFNQFFVSHYLNELITDSGQRATALSFRGLAYNLAYGGAGLLFAGLTRYLREYPNQHGNVTEDSVFIASLSWLPWYFVVTTALLIVTIVRRRRPSN